MGFNDFYGSKNFSRNITRTLTQEHLILLHDSNKGADIHAHLGSLTSTFVVQFLESIVVKLATCEISIF